MRNKPGIICSALVCFLLLACGSTDVTPAHETSAENEVAFGVTFYSHPSYSMSSIAVIDDKCEATRYREGGDCLASPGNIFDLSPITFQVP